jgi:tetratricopeptide (TPR) repeat protein
MAAIEDDHSSSASHGLSNVERLEQAAQVLLQAQDAIISELPIPTGRRNDNEDLEKADSSALHYVLLNNGHINDIRFKNCRLLLSAGLPSFAIGEFSALSSLTFDRLDEFYRALCVSIGPRKAYDWYVDSFELISKKLSDYDSSILSNNYKIFAATCMACALEGKDYELAEHIADSSDASPPFQHKFLEWICILYWLLPHRQEDAGKWSEIAIANNCPSAYPHIIKCRSLLAQGDFQEAIACLDRAERFFYSNGLQEAYASILHERSTLMEGMS